MLAPMRPAPTTQKSVSVQPLPEHTIPGMRVTLIAKTETQSENSSRHLLEKKGGFVCLLARALTPLSLQP